MPGHPAVTVGVAHKKRIKGWLRGAFEAAGITCGLPLACQAMLLLDGSSAVALLHRDPSYIEMAGEAAHSLVEGGA